MPLVPINTHTWLGLSSISVRDCVSRHSNGATDGRGTVYYRFECLASLASPPIILKVKYVYVLSPYLSGFSRPLVRSVELLLRIAPLIIPKSREGKSDLCGNSNLDERFD